MKSIKHLYRILLMCMLLSCEEIIEPEKENVDTSDLVVVEGLLTNENKNHRIKLSRTIAALNETPQPINNATIQIEDGENVYELSLDPIEPGVYITNSFSAVFDKVYTLSIDLDGQLFSAEAMAAQGSNLEALNISGVEGGFQYNYEESAQPSMMEVIATWTEIDSSNQVVSREIHAFFYTLKVVEVNQIFAPDKTPVRFPAGTRLIRRKYSLSREHQLFLRSFLSEVDWRGSFFDVAQGNVITNLSEGAVGFFGVSMVQSDTTMVN